MFQHVWSLLPGFASFLRPGRGLRGEMPLRSGKSAPGQTHPPFPVEKTDAAWRAALTPEQYRVLRAHGTERPGESTLNGEKRAGAFLCAACENVLFDSATKYESGSGWPSFYEPMAGAVGTRQDRTLGMRRVEVHCARCGGHLGHVFPDGPRPTGLRFCMNGTALKFAPRKDEPCADGTS